MKMLCQDCKVDVEEVEAIGASLAWDGYRRCPACLEAALEVARVTGRCPRPRCGAPLSDLDKRHLYCTRCGAVVARDGGDRLVGVSKRRHHAPPDR